MTRQAEAFLQREGDAWFNRNLEFIKTRTRENDVLFGALRSLFSQARGMSYLEIGCSNGYRLSWIKELGVTVCGIEPGRSAVEDGIVTTGLVEEEIVHTDAYAFFQNNRATFDVIAFAHSLYLIEPAEIPRIVSGVVESLNEGGYVVIYDFDAIPHARSYHHREGVVSYKADFSRYFTWLPFMRLISKSVTEHKGGLSCGNPQEDCALSVIRKIPMEHAFPQLAGPER